MTRLLPLALLAFVGCGDGKSDDSTPATGSGSTPTGTTGGTTTGCVVTTVPPPSGDPLTVSLDGECDLADKWGSFLVATYDIFSIVDGKVASGVVPITVTEDVTDPGYTGTECKLLRRNNPFCSPQCNPDETCDFDGNCIPFPQNQDVGTVTIGGLEKEVIMEPLQPGNNYFDTQMPHPGFLPGELIELQTGECGVYDPITLHGVGVETLVLTDTNWTVFDGQDLPFSWNAPTIALNPGQHVQVRLNIDQHGNTPVQLFCEFPDTGSAALPSILIDQLMNFGVTGFPNATVTRRTVDKATLSSGGCADLVVSSPADPNVLVDGYIPCIPGGNTCPTGMTCNDITGLCE